MLRVPTGLVTTRNLRIAGVAIPAGTVLDNPQIGQIKDLQALLAKGWIAPAEDLYGRRTRLGNPQPTYVPPVVLNAMEFAAATVPLELYYTVDEENDRRLTVHIVNGNGPFTISWGDGSSSTVQGQTSTHTYVDYSSWWVNVDDANGAHGAIQVEAVASVDPGA